MALKLQEYNSETNEVTMEVFSEIERYKEQYEAGLITYVELLKSLGTMILRLLAEEAK